VQGHVGVAVGRLATTKVAVDFGCRLAPDQVVLVVCHTLVKQTPGVQGLMGPATFPQDLKFTQTVPRKLFF